MRVLRLYIRNSGVFKNTLIDFTHKGEPQDMICLAGVNGSGKTTIMELIFNLINFVNSDLSVEDIFFDRLKPNILSRIDFAQLDLLIEGKILSLVLGNSSDIIKTDSGDQAFIVENDIKKIISHFEDNVVKIPEDEEKSKIIRLRGVRYEEQFSSRKIDKINIGIFETLLNRINKALYDENNVQNEEGSLPFIYFFNAHDREVHDIRYKGIKKDVPKYQIAYRYHPKKDDIKKKLVFYGLVYQDKFEELKNWINKYVLIGQQIDKIDGPNFEVVIKTRDGNKHGLELLSSGEESLLILATQLYLRASDNAVFLIDEVDQSLHPEFQEKVMKLLKQLQKDKCCQIIVSSHSDVIWNTFNNKGLIDLTEMVL